MLLPSSPRQNLAIGLSKVPPRVRFLLLALAISVYLLYICRVWLNHSLDDDFFRGRSHHLAHPSTYASESDVSQAGQASRVDGLQAGHVGSEEYVSPAVQGSKLDVLQAAQNATLGFGKIFYISLPYRTDRQDQMTLLAASTNLKIHHQPGVLGAEIHEKAKPNEAGNLRAEQLGCWRSHADVWRRVVDEDIDTALILEDDADWDVNVHEIFEELGVQMRKGKLRKTPASDHELQNAPYGLDWDLFYVGTCFDIPNTDNRPKHQYYDDPYGPNRAEQGGSFVGELEGWGLKVTNDTRQRVIAPSWYPVCTLGYAVTRRGAQKLLYTVGGVKGIGSAIDLTMSDRIQKGMLDSFTVVPPLITPWKTASTRDSDIDDLKEKQEKEGEELKFGSENLQNSARRALEKNLGGPPQKQ